MGGKIFKVIVNGEEFQVEVEEMQNAGSSKLTPSVLSAQNLSQGESKFSVDSNIKQTQPPIGTNISTAGFPVKAPMPGSIIEVKVATGDVIKENDIVVILEAMKMENEVTSPVGGKVLQVLVGKGTTVSSGETLLVIQ